MNVELAFGVFIVCIIVSRVLSEKALKVLSLEEKGMLTDSFSRMRMFYLIPLVILFGGFYLLNKYANIATDTLLTGYWVLLLIYVVMSFIITLNKLNKLNLPPDYLKKFSMSQIVQYFGLGVLFIAII